MLKYNAKEIEEKWKKYWEKEKIYKFDPKSQLPVYSIDTPPPYASAGHLHVGHALSYTQFEIIARIKRMLGYNVYFAPCFDNNGLPTEKYVEEKLGINKSETNRTEFRKLCLKESAKVEKDYTNNVFKKLGHSYSWDLLYTTISPEAQKVSQASFLKLAKKGECYKAKEPTIWCPHHETALAQAEVEDLTRKTKLNYIAFGDKERILIATTRPELLCSCVGIFVNPKDKRYKKLVGKTIMVPLFNYGVKVKTDESVDPKFGTGILMTCTFGDNADIEKWKKYKLGLKISFDEKGRLNENAGKYKGLSINEARIRILKDLEKEGRLIKQVEIEQTVGSCWRCNNAVEYIVKDQWFIKTLKHKKKLIEFGKKINWYPNFMRTRYENWVKNLSWDWAISRQRYYGVPIPVWYCDNCNEIIYADIKDLPIDPMEVKKKCPKCNVITRPETDVFDTWMTSSNSPEIALRWFDNPKQYEKLSPMSLRPQSHDIIRTWAFYTILKSYLLFNRIPWKDITINTFVLDPKGKGMSKSKGNAVWADDLIGKYGVDVFRYWVWGASLGNDLPFNEQDLVAGKKFLNKLWNASNFVFMNLENYNGKAKPTRLETIDSWVLEKTAEMVEKAKSQYMDYNIPGAKRTIEDFFYKVFTDNYLEIVKKRMYGEDCEEKLSAEYTLYQILYSIIKLVAPIMPFITEELYQEYFNNREDGNKSIHLEHFPDIKIKLNTKNNFDLFVSVLSKIRQVKTSKQKSMKSEIILSLDVGTLRKLGETVKDLADVTNAKTINKGKFKVDFI